MRPDEHKAKESRRYQARKKHQGDATAAEVAERRRAAAKAHDNGTSIAAIKRRNGELPSLQQEHDEEEAKLKARSKQFSRRKLVSNQYRYQEMTEQDEMEQDAEMGVDRETTNLVAMLEKNDETSGSNYFRFKEEQEWDTEPTDFERQDTYKNTFQVDFGMLESVLHQADTSALLDLSEEDSGLVDMAFQQEARTLEKPLVPAFSKNSRGLVLFKGPLVTGAEPAKPSEEDRICLRNDGSNHHAQKSNIAQEEEKKQRREDEDDIDELLALDSTAAPAPKKGVIPKAAPPSIPAKAPISKPGSIKRPMKPSAQPAAKPASVDDDEAWLDDLLEQ